jgi:Porin subfamily
MTSTKQVLLSTAAATIVVAAGGNISAQAADQMVRKAPPIQFVKVCDMYGNGFFVIPGTTLCLQIRGQVQLDNAYQPTSDALSMTQSKSGVAGQNIMLGGQQDHWGYEVTSKTRFDMRTETSMGTMRAYAELKLQLDAGAFQGPFLSNGGEIGAGNKSELYRAYLQFAGWTAGEIDSIWSLGAFKDGDILNVVNSDKASGWGVYYTWTPNGPGLPPVKGSAPVPDGWSVSFGAETPIKHVSKAQFGDATYADLNLAAGSTAGAGAVNLQQGPLVAPDVLVRLHYEADPTGKDPQANDQWGIGTFHASAVLHQISTIVNGEASLGTPGYVNLISTPNDAFGPANKDTGWAVQGYLKIFTPMFGGAKMGSLRASDSDSLSFNALYGVAALEYVGIGGTNGNLGAGDAYWAGGFARDDEDARWINRGNGTYYADKEKALAVNGQYHHILTDCTDPLHCWRMNLHANYVWATPGTITQNVDWTQGGLGKARKMALTADLIWGANVFGKSTPTSWEVGFEVQYLKVWQDLPCANNGNVGVCIAPTALPANISKDPSTYVGRVTITRDW